MGVKIFIDPFVVVLCVQGSVEDSLPGRYGFLHGRLSSSQRRFVRRSGAETAIDRSTGKPATTAAPAGFLATVHSTISNRLAFLLREEKKIKTEQEIKLENDDDCIFSPFFLMVVAYFSVKFALITRTGMRNLAIHHSSVSLI